MCTIVRKFLQGVHNMSSNELIQDKSFFVMEDESVKTYYGTEVIDGTAQILVYNWENPLGICILDTSEIKTVINEHSNEYSNNLKSLLCKIAKDLNLPEKRLLHNYISSIWNEDMETAEECYWEDCCLPEKFIAYMETLLDNCTSDRDTVLVFKERYCDQELVYPKYSKEWLKNYLSVPA